ncbi:SufD family Fe-S cluster assembly protein [Fructobacillus sp. M1-13]|uniref:SufD family Fe-S cluster assembly protein n=1 Tax=Fructobacillus papyriferae TaxID=2713171 RepID=A0ABS5QPQ0_9LACO|nr:SufD family Fe-S cluster assembly protein [Fructobacillus papyriferae]MBS9335066.1 SufD family Fe-S cluster assembly protein [Fructobacillus papyriferae]MCD2159448.1 SufD family Fe-S cluster assembly protein [Fructobacillus papyriferae]
MKEQKSRAPLPRFDKVNLKAWQLEDLDLNKTAQHFLKAVVPDEATKAGVTLIDLANQEKNTVPGFKAFGQVAKANQDRLTEENQASYQGGYQLLVPAGVQLTKPIFVQQILGHENFASRAAIHIGAGAKVTILEKIEGPTDETNLQKKVWGSLVEELVIEREADVRLITIDELNKQTTAYLNRQILLEEGANLDWRLAGLSAHQVASSQGVLLKGHGSQAKVQVVALAREKEQLGFQSQVNHVGRHTVARIDQRGVNMEAGQLIFNGIGRINLGAKEADADQKSSIMMLSEKGRGEANPLLLIDEPDVTAGHAASVGQIDQEQLAYLMSRGLRKEQAEQLVIRGVLNHIQTGIGQDELLAFLENSIERKITYYEPTR